MCGSSRRPRRSSSARLSARNRRIIRMYSSKSRCTTGRSSRPCCRPISRGEPSRCRNRQPPRTASRPRPSVQSPSAGVGNCDRAQVMPAVSANALSIAPITRRCQRDPVQHGVEKFLRCDNRPWTIVAFYPRVIAIVTRRGVECCGQETRGAGSCPKSGAQCKRVISYRARTGRQGREMSGMLRENPPADDRAGRAAGARDA